MIILFAYMISIFLVMVPFLFLVCKPGDTRTIDNGNNYFACMIVRYINVYFWRGSSDYNTTEYFFDGTF